MKLYYKPGACSLSPHIVLQESGLTFETTRVDLVTKVTEDGADFRAVNAKGSVPALVLDDGQLLTEGVAIVQYVADLVPALRLAPPAGTMERYRLLEWLNYICSEVHKSFGGLFNPRSPDAWKAVVRELLAARFDFLSTALDGKTYLMGETFTVADAYLFTCLCWPKYVDIDMSRWPVLTAYWKRILQRPAVQATLKAEGLI